MSFFKKLKNRLFKSSAKLEEGLEAIVQEGGLEEQVEQAIEPGTHEELVEMREVAGVPMYEPELLPAEGPVPEPVPERQPETEVETPPATEAAPETVQEAAPQPEAEPEPEVEAAPAEVREPQAPPTPAGPPTPAAPTEPAAEPVPAPTVTKASQTAPSAESPKSGMKKSGILGRILGRGENKTVMRRVLDDDMLESLEELLISADMGVDTALRVTANMAQGRFGKRLSVAEIKKLMAQEIAHIMEPVAKPLPLYAQKPQVVLVVGVNGSGKTTTIGKLASQLREAGKSVVIAAGDTFRAAAVEQLQVWGERAGVPVLTAPEGSDPASLAFDAMTKAQADGADLLLIDTAGRLQNRADLME